MEEFEKQGGIAFVPDHVLPPGHVLLSALPDHAFVLESCCSGRQKTF